MRNRFFKTIWFKGFLAVLFLSFVLQPVIAETPDEKKAKEAKSTMKGVGAVAAIAGVAAGGIAVMLGAPIIAGVGVAIGVGVLAGMAVKAGLNAIDSVSKSNQQRSDIEKAVNGEGLVQDNPFDESETVKVK